MSSNCDSDGVPIDQDGQRMEDLFPHTAPFAIRTDIFQELFSGSGKDIENEHLDGGPLGESSRHHSSSGGIPLAEDVLIEDYYSSDEVISPREARERCKSNTSATVQAVLRTSKHERDELVRARKKLQDVLKFLRSKGFSEEDIYKGLAAEGFGPVIPNRCEFGLPQLEPICTSSSGTGNPSVEKTKKIVGDENAAEMCDVMPKKNLNLNVGNIHELKDAHTVVGDKPSSDPYKDKMKSKVGTENGGDAEISQGNGAGGTVKPSWSSVVKNASPVEDLAFDYHPLPEGATMVTPPSDVLKKGLQKFQLCLVGVFSKGTLPFSKMVECARKTWDSRGLCHVSQKDSHTFLFKFKTEMEMNAVLARGTWYFERKPLLLHTWTSDLGNAKVSSIPLWVRFKNLPDYYWTREGLSCVASSIGPPICADKVTSQLNLVQFAKLCVRYTIGDPLPEKIKVAVMDVKTQELSTTDFAMVEVSYPQRPMICSGCNQLGHLIGACPSVKRVWVQKSTGNNSTAGTEAPPSNDADLNSKPIVNEAATVDSLDVNKNSVPAVEVEQSEQDNTAEWTTVKGKKIKSSEKKGGHFRD